MGICCCWQHTDSSSSDRERGERGRIGKWEERTLRREKRREIEKRVSGRVIGPRCAANAAISSSHSFFKCYFFSPLFLLSVHTLHSYAVAGSTLLHNHWHWKHFPSSFTFSSCAFSLSTLLFLAFAYSSSWFVFEWHLLGMNIGDVHLKVEGLQSSHRDFCSRLTFVCFLIVWWLRLWKSFSQSEHMFFMMKQSCYMILTAFYKLNFLPPLSHSSVSYWQHSFYWGHFYQWLID